jgi:two-component system phosphate regulon sensor histidine kinase PhoR
METDQGFLGDRNPNGKHPNELAFCQFVLNSVPAGILTVDSGLEITGFYPWAEKITGYSKKEALGRFCGDVLRGGLCDGHCPLRTALRREKPMMGIETTIQSKNGRSIPVRMNTAALFDDKENLIGGVEVFQDMSHLKALRRERDNMISMIAHDMKLPVISIHGFAHRLMKRKGKGSEEKHGKYLDIIEKEATKLESLINDFLEFSRYQTGSLKLNFSATSLDKELHEIYDAYHPRAKERGLELKLNSGDALPIIEADPERLRRVFTNLLDNAIKCSNESGTITISTIEIDEEVVVEVEDEGFGMDPADFPYIFETFHRIYGGAYKEGFGLGLAGVKAIVEGHGGKVRVKSELGKGTVFTIRLPKSQRQRQV